MILRSAIVLLFVVGSAAPVPALAQALGTSALKGQDTHAPIDVDSDRIEVLDKENQAVFSGNVRATQAKMTLEADRVRVSYTRPAKGNPVIRRLDADGNVRLTTPSERATARFGIYDVEERILTLVGNVVLARGASRADGNRLTIDLDSGRSTLDGKSAGGSGSGGRVSGRFEVPERKQ
jgi:lipopolysaccharide export system protein LptA